MILRNVFLIAAVILMANCGGLKCSQSTNEDNCLGEQSLAVYKTNGHSCVWLNGACKESTENKDILRAKKNASYEKAKADGQKAPENLKKACKDFVQAGFIIKSTKVSL